MIVKVRKQYKFEERETKLDKLLEDSLLLVALWGVGSLAIILAGVVKMYIESS